MSELVANDNNKYAHRHQARESAVQYLYQCEREKIFYFNNANFDNFVANFAVDVTVKPYLRRIVEGTLSEMPTIDEKLKNVSANWRIERMSSTDRCVLRLAVWELVHKEAPRKVIINEAIDIAKKYGTEDSGRFVNGLLDKISKSKLS